MCLKHDVNFFPLHPSMKPRDLHNYHNFQILYAIFGFLWTSVHTLVIKFPDKDASTFKFTTRFLDKCNASELQRRKFGC